MALVNLREMVYHAYRNHYAIGAFDIVSLDFLHAVIGGAEAQCAPVILNLVEHQFHLYDFEILAAAAVCAARRAGVPVAIQLDHATTTDSVLRGIRYGCNGVMIDGSELSFEENVRLTRRVVDVAHSCGIPVEAELGHVARRVGDERPGSRDQPVYTSPDEVKLFQRRTKADFLAVSIGNVHGQPVGRGQLDLTRLARIHALVDVPLVIHGGSGLSDAEFGCLIDRGVAKINYYTMLSTVAARRIRGNAIEDRAGAYGTLVNGVREVIQQEVERCLALWRAADRADAVLSEVAPWSEVEHMIVYNTIDESDEPVLDMMAEGRRVLGNIPGVRRVVTGRAVTKDAKYRYCWLVRFAHAAVINTYRDHPAHVEFANTLFRPRADNRISIDFTEVNDLTDRERDTTPAPIAG
ncbi:MAG: ketose-bisphosphate aldolase [Gammaproteobacteria bacterium]|nr:MAG: ketose-bisphosphate aldolase [Gammaproteobacteria bacterium]TND07112.1 MAG: ketose-bisphosphate aldolase [Gammaproteobacteria bacterium]